MHIHTHALQSKANIVPQAGSQLTKEVSLKWLQARYSTGQLAPSLTTLFSDSGPRSTRGHTDIFSFYTLGLHDICRGMSNILNLEICTLTELHLGVICTADDIWTLANGVYVLASFLIGRSLCVIVEGLIAC